MTKHRTKFSLLFPLSTVIYAGSNPCSPVSECPQFPLSPTKTPTQFNAAALPPASSADSLADAAGNGSPLGIELDHCSLRASPIAGNPNGEVRRHAEYWVASILEPCPLLKSLASAGEIEIFSGMSNEHIKKIIEASFSLYPNTEELDINTFQLVFNPLKKLSLRGDDIFERALGVMRCVKNKDSCVSMCEVMGVSIDTMDNVEFAERLELAEKHAHKPYPCNYYFMIGAMKQPIEDVKKVLLPFK